MPTPTEIVRAQFDAVNRGDFAAAMDLYGEDVELRGGGYVYGDQIGRAAVGEWFGDWFRSFATRQFEILEISEHGDAVAMSARLTATGRHSGAALSQDFHYAYWVANEKITRVQFFPSIADALEAIRVAAKAR
jgi:ketosteroid isomerase-like protein